MKKGNTLVIIVILALVAVAGFLVWQKSQVQPKSEQAPPPLSEDAIEQVDLSKQPVWAQNLQVTSKLGTGARGLKMITYTVTGMPAGAIQSLTYEIGYQTSDKGYQGDLSNTPTQVGGKTTVTITSELGTCSTKTCVFWNGVKTADMRLDFKATDGSTPAWSKSLNLQ